MSDINKNCLDCSNLDNTIIDNITPVCGVALGLGHWSDTKRWCRDGEMTCPHKKYRENRVLRSYEDRVREAKYLRNLETDKKNRDEY